MNYYLWRRSARRVTKRLPTKLPPHKRSIIIDNVARIHPTGTTRPLTPNQQKASVSMPPGTATSCCTTPEDYYAPHTDPRGTPMTDARRHTIILAARSIWKTPRRRNVDCKYRLYGGGFPSEIARPFPLTAFLTWDDNGWPP